MSKIRSMGAGSANLTYRANSMLVQIGNKLQGLPPTTNKPAAIIPHIRSRANGDKRDWIFCINQLAGGVGRHVGEFAPGADGVKNCIVGPYGTPASLFNCNSWYRIAELSNWVKTQLSSMFATMNQPIIDSSNSSFYNYLGLTLLPTTMFNNGTDSGATVTSITPNPLYTTTYNNYALVLDALINSSVWGDHNSNTVPNLDIFPFISSSVSTTINNLSGQGFTNAANLIGAIATNIILPANVNVLNTLNELSGKTFQIPGYPGSLKYAVYIFPEAFVGTNIMQNMAVWLQNAQSANHRGAAQWAPYAFSGNGSRNGLTWAVSNKYGSGTGQLPNIRMCKLTNVCDIDQDQVVGASDSAPGTVSTIGNFPLTSNITTSYLVQE